MDDGKQIIDNNELLKRRKRVKRLKKIIVITIIILLVVPTICCVFLLFKVYSLEKQINVLCEDRKEEYSKQLSNQAGSVQTNGVQVAYAAENNGKNDTEKNKESGNAVKAEPVIEKKVYLTFDDGPSIHTEEILKVLKKYNIKATFFTIGKTDETSMRLYKKIVDEGHTLGMHSYSHEYENIYKSLKSFESDYNKISSLLYKATGEIPEFYRFPGGSSNQVSTQNMSVFIKFLNDKKITYFDWNVMNGDAVTRKLSKNELIDNVMNGVKVQNESVVLMHDIAIKENTVKALPVIIEKLQKDGYKILPIDKNVTPVQHIRAKTVK